MVMVAWGAGPAWAQAERALFDFEGPGGLEGLTGVYGAKLELSRDHVTRGKQSLKLMLGEHAYPGFRGVVTTTDWTKSDYLVADVYVEGDRAAQVGLWLKSPKATSVETRFNWRGKLGPGENHVAIPLEAVWQAERKALWGTIDRGEVTELGMFASAPGRELTLYVDGIALAKDGRRQAPEAAEGGGRFDGSVLFDFRSMGVMGRSGGFFLEAEIPLEGGQVRKVKLSEGKKEEMRFWLTDHQLSGYKGGGAIVARAWYLDNYETVMNVREIKLAAGQTEYVRYTAEDF